MSGKEGSAMKEPSLKEKVRNAILEGIFQGNTNQGTSSMRKVSSKNTNAANRPSGNP